MIIRDRSSDLALYIRLLRLARPYWLHIAALFLIGLLSTPLALLGPLPLKIVVDSVIGTQPLPGLLSALAPERGEQPGALILALAAGIVVATALLSHLQGLAVAVLRAYTGEKLVLGFRSQLFRHAQRLSIAYHDAKGPTHSIYRIQYDALAIQHIAIDGVLPFITAVMMLIAMIAVTARIDWQLAVVALAISPVLYFLSQAYRHPLRARYRTVKDLDTTAFSVIQEVLGAVRVVKAFGKEDDEQERFVRHSHESVLARIRLAGFEGGFGMLLGLVTAVGTAVVLVIGVLHVQAGLITLGDLLVVMAYLGQLYAPLRTISSKVADIQASLTSAERAFALLDEPSDVIERPNARPVARASGVVAFRQVSFGYSTGRTILDDLSFDIQPGMRVGIMGATGAGKTTLISLLTRFYDPTSGQVLLDGVDLRDYKLADLRQQFALVLQDSVLFSTTIAENIAYARPGASHEEIVAAARAANAHDFILQFPGGYEARVGERGLRLSGGERQRIALARAFLKDAPVLILDEPTSSVDIKTEAAIMEALERLTEGRTTFIITHRLSTLEGCDLILRIEAGRLAAASDRLPELQGHYSFVRDHAGGVV